MESLKYHSFSNSLHVLFLVQCRSIPWNLKRVQACILWGQDMIKLRSQSTRSLVFRVFRIGAALLGCLFFLFSFISPFYQFNVLTQTEGSYSVHLWSFKADVQAYWLRSPSQPRQLWYSDYWFRFEWIQTFPSSTWVLMSIFIFQILALTSGVASIIFDRRLLSPAPVLLCLTVIELMTYVNIELDKWNLLVNSVQQGYWLAYPSMLLFLFSSIVNMVSKRNVKMTSTPTHTQTQ